MRINVNAAASHLLIVATIAAWVVLLLGLFVPVPHVFDQLILAVAGVGGVASMRRLTNRPIEEVFDAGREYQRRIDMHENTPRGRHENHDNVVGLRG